MSSTEDTIFSESDVDTIITDGKRNELALATINKQIDNSIIIKDNINKLKVIVEDSIEDNGINPTSAHLLSLAVESLLRPIEKDDDYLKVKDDSISFPSLENFEFRRERQINTQISLENINAKWRSFWLWLGEKIKRIIKTLQQYHKQRTFFIDRLIERIERTDRYLKEANLVSDKRFISKDRLSNDLSINGRVPINLKEHVNNFNKITKMLLNSSTNNHTEKLVESLKLYINNPTTNIKSPLADALSAKPFLTKISDIENTVLSKYESINLFGNRRLVYYTLRDDSNWTVEQLVKDITRIGGHLEYIEPTLQPSNNIPVLGINDLKIIMSNVKQTIYDVRGYVKDLNRLFKSLNDLSLFTTTLANRKQLSGNENKIRDKLIHDLAIKLPRLLQEPMYGYTTYAANTCRQLTHYIELCVGMR